MLLANTIALLYMSFLVMSMHDHDLINVDGGADQGLQIQDKVRNELVTWERGRAEKQE